VKKKIVKGESCGNSLSYIFLSRLVSKTKIKIRKQKQKRGKDRNNEKDKRGEPTIKRYKMWIKMEEGDRKRKDRRGEKKVGRENTKNEEAMVMDGANRTRGNRGPCFLFIVICLTFFSV
jgi:hypothetical protein